MSVIDGPIPQKAFEIIHDRIGAILLDELDNQFRWTYLPDLDRIVTRGIFKERDIPFSEGELPALNVMLERGDYSFQTLKQLDGDYRYIIEATFTSEARGDAKGANRGDTLAMTRMQRVLGIIHGIFMSPKYRTLGFNQPFIKNRHFENIYFGRPLKQDAWHTVVGRLTLVVGVPETTDVVDGTLAAGFDTHVKLDLTEKGYIWILEP